MQELIPSKVIGKKYLWRPIDIEYRCYNCGSSKGAVEDGFTAVVIILHASENDDRQIICGECHAPQDMNPEGWWDVETISTKEIGMVPYTQLEEIKEEE
ncbi:hypothetical protein LCGC14_1062880 [marine sediment metagenome]|uniref:Uncharacterized protein n=1 Tax=marine sediment metagenome TaxID=412755 RepID=A0A0F9MKM1_9ZZZZ